MQKIDVHKSRLDKNNSEIKKVESSTMERVQVIQDWFEDIREKSAAEVPAKIVKSLQEIISDSATGIVVEPFHGELRDMRRFILSGQQMTDGLKNLVISMWEQRDKTFVFQNHPRDTSLHRLVED